MDLHHYVMFFLIIILFVVVLMLGQALIISDERFRLRGPMISRRKARRTFRAAGFYFNKQRLLADLLFKHRIPADKVSIEEDRQYYHQIVHSTDLELIWTAVPSLILLVIALPSMFVLYLLDEPAGYVLTVFKVIGHQWYWTYEIAETSSIGFSSSEGTLPFGVSFDSYMLPTELLPLGEFRLLGVDNALIVPVETPLSFIITSSDVLHSWAVPSLGIKVDAVPGRLNQAYMLIDLSGEYYGQCSELCGINHGFMPIKIISI